MIGSNGIHIFKNDVDDQTTLWKPSPVPDGWVVVNFIICTFRFCVN